MKVLEVDHERYLVSLYGDSGRVHNLRAQRTARLRRGREVEEVVATELAHDEKQAVAQAYRATASREATRKQLAWAADDAAEKDARRGAMSVPMFRLSRRETPPRRAGETSAN